jgi:type VI secretion system protein ImpI
LSILGVNLGERRACESAQPAFVLTFNRKLLQIGAQRRFALKQGASPAVNRMDIDVPAFQHAFHDIGAAVRRNHPPAAALQRPGAAFRDCDIGNVQCLIAYGELGMRRAFKENGKCRQRNDARAAAGMLVCSGQVVSILGLSAKSCKRHSDRYYTALGLMQLLLTLKNAEKFGLTDAVKRMPSDSSLSIGRGKQAGWMLPDPTRMLSAVHCEIKCEQGRCELTDFSSNGTRLNGQAMERMAAVLLADGDQIEIGPYQIFVGKGAGASAEPDQKTVVLRTKAPQSVSSALSSDKTVIGGRKSAETQWAVDPILARQLDRPQATPVKKPAHKRGAAAHSGSRRFVDAFCEGAGLDPDALAGRADVEFAQELGALMRRLIPGILELSHSQNELRAVIGSAQKSSLGDFDDAPTGAAAKRKRAERLLAAQFEKSQGDDPTAGETLSASVDDALRHNKALFQAMQTALFRLLNELSPTAIERQTKTGLIRSRSAQNWNAYLRRWELMNMGGEDGMLDVFIHYLGEAYDAKMRDV